MDCGIAARCHAWTGFWHGRLTMALYHRQVSRHGGPNKTLFTKTNSGPPPHLACGQQYRNPSKGLELQCCCPISSLFFHHSQTPPTLQLATL